jgi:hypothetical protein
VQISGEAKKILDRLCKAGGWTRTWLVEHLLYWFEGRRETERTAILKLVDDEARAFYAKLLRQYAEELDPTPQPYLEVVESETEAPSKTAGGRKRSHQPRAELAHQVTT